MIHKSLGLVSINFKRDLLFKDYSNDVSNLNIEWKTEDTRF